MEGLKFQELSMQELEEVNGGSASIYEKKDIISSTDYVFFPFLFGTKQKNAFRYNFVLQRIFFYHKRLPGRFVHHETIQPELPEFISIVS